MINPKEAARRSQEAEEKLNAESRQEALRLLPSVEELILETTKEGKYAFEYHLKSYGHPKHNTILTQLGQILGNMGFKVRNSRDLDGKKTLVIGWGNIKDD